MLYLSLILTAATLGTPTVDADFEKRQAELPSEIFEVFNDRIMTPEEEEALKFLYTYMPLPDLAGHSADFHLDNVKATLRARKEMPWGEKIPDREFRHFVLPLRVNNEALDMSRPVIYEMLADRVKGMSMKDAILEVNHWCHEHVTYKPSDGRTSPPLSTMSQAIGRCGEESTFTVAALRAVGIPARQVYTPRWAHTDDNHAWVEAWADGEWYFLGACEPAPILDMAWFNAPASRGMMMTTNVFGAYDGPEEKLAVRPLVTTINVTDKYAPVGELKVRVVDSNGNPVKDADVAFCIYNYADFYPVTTKKSDESGQASLIVGKGDAVMWASDGTNFGWTKGSPKEDTVYEIVLDKDSDYTGTFEMTIVPPSGSGTLPSPSADLVKANELRLADEDRIRKEYESTFLSDEDARQLANTLPGAVAPDRIVSILMDSRGNSRMLAEMFASLPESQIETAVNLLENVTEKDRRDIPREVITDNLEYHYVGGMMDDSHRRDACGACYYQLEIWAPYVLSPRIDTEQLVPFKKEIASRLGEDKLREFRKDPFALVKWVNEKISVETVSNPMSIRMDPMTVLNLRKTDPLSRDIFFVAVARTAGIPSRIDPVTGKVQVMTAGNDGWTDVKFSDGTESATAPSEVKKSHLQLNYTPTGHLTNPRYYNHFAISKIEGGFPTQLEYEDGYGVEEINKENEPLDEGQYMLMSGQRMADGSVLVRGEIFVLKDGSDAELPLIIREDPAGVQVIGNLNAENLYRPLGEDADRSILSTTGRGYYVLGIIGAGQEPSAHALNDLSAVSDELEKWGHSIVVLFPDDDSASRFDAGHFSGLPSNLTFGVDTGNLSQDELRESLNLTDPSLPIFVIADSFNRVVFVTQGYTIGLGDRILETLGKIKE